MPPARTGVAEYASALLGGLERHGKVRLGRDGEVNLYQIGNNQLHREIYERSLRRPGAVLLHDAVLHHFYLGALRREQYIEEFAFNYGEWSRGLADRLWTGRARSGAAIEYFQYPMLRRLAETAKLIFVHNPAAAAMVRRHSSAAKVVEIPHLFVDPPEIDVEHHGRTIRFGVFGHLRESKRVASVLRVFGRLGLDARLLLAGDFVSRDLEHTLQPLLDTPGVERLPYAGDETEFWRRAWSTDVCINLRYPPAGETSGIAIRFMGIGKPVVMSAGPETDGFPDGTCVRIETGLREEAMLEEILIWLAQFPYDRDAIGRNAREYIRRVHSLDKVAVQVWQALPGARG